MTARTELVVASLEAWDHVWRRNQYLVAALLEDDPDLVVLFVEPPADPLDAARRGALPRRGRGLRRARTGAAYDDRLWLYQPTKLLPRRVDPGADARLQAGSRRAARRLGFRAPVLWANDPAAARLLEATGWPSLYDVTDDWLAADAAPAHLARVAADERVLLERSVEVTVCSESLRRSKPTGRPVTVVTNGVDVERYRTPAPRPDDLPDGPVALYVGTVHPDRFDTALAARTGALARDAGTLVVVGPVHSVPRPELARLADAGVLVLGARPFDAVPAYMQHADVLVVPHLVNSFTESLDPIKLYEYRAVGRPVVSTPVAGFRDADDARVRVAAADAFPGAVREALASARDDGAAFPLPAPAAAVPTWASQARVMAQVVDRVRHAATRP